jgi:UDP-glucose 4-epimerase
MISLVTGGSGFIGSSLVSHLIAKDVQVVVLDDFSGSKIENLSSQSNSSNLEIIVGSILDEALVTKLMKGVTHCFHLAANVGVEKINIEPIKSLEVNLRGSEIVLLS